MERNGRRNPGVASGHDLAYLGRSVLRPYKDANDELLWRGLRLSNAFFWDGGREVAA